MILTVAIQPDDYTASGKPPESDASSPRWASFLEAAGFEVRWVDVYRPDILDQLQGCQGFMWRWAHFAGMHQIARRLLPVVERELGLAVYPDQNTCWHYDDKVTQSYLFQALKIPSPATWVFFTQEAAVEWVSLATYPLVIKLWGGAGSANVELVRDIAEARDWIQRLFDRGVYAMSDPASPRPWPVGIQRCRSALKLLLTGIGPKVPPPSEESWDLHKNYVLFQEFLDSNAYDTRVTVIGKRAFAYRRHNRTNDFRASGSGNFDTDPSKIAQDAVRLAFHVAERLRSQSVAIDCLRRGRESVVGEVSYTYVSWMVQSCPGHWELEGKPNDGVLTWRSGHMWPEEAQVEDFMARMKVRHV